MKKLLFTINNCQKMARSLTLLTPLKKGRCKLGRFADREILVQVQESVRGLDVFVLGSTCPPCDNLVELLLLLHALKVNGAKRIHLVMPYFGYAKADEIKPKGTSLAAKLVAEAIALAGATDLTVVNLHSEKALSFLPMPVCQLSAMTLLANYFKKKKLKDLAVAAPDKGGILRAQEFAAALGIGKIIRMRKKRPGFDKVQMIGFQGDVKGKNVIIADDMIQSGCTLQKAALALRLAGAKNVYAAATHLLPSGPAIKLLEKERALTEIVVTNTVLANEKLPKKFKVLRIEPLLAAALQS